MIDLIYLALVIGGVVFVGYPLVTGKREEPSFSPRGPLDDLSSDKEATYIALKELDFDYRTGKLSEEDYHELREKYRAKAFSLLKVLDERERGEDVDMERAIEEEILAVRKGRRGTGQRDGTGEKDEVCPQCGMLCAPEDTFCSLCGARLRLICGVCGARYQGGDRFCTSCGEDLQKDEHLDS